MILLDQYTSYPSVKKLEGEMDKYLETFQTWNKVAKLYEDKFMDLDLYNETYETFCELLLKKNPSILEIGCGPGNITKYLLDKRPDFEILGTDISPNMIELVKTNCPNAMFEVIDSREIENIKNKFDAIVCGFCLPYLSELDVEKFIIDCENLLNENGKIYLSFVEGEKDKWFCTWYDLLRLLSIVRVPIPKTRLNLASNLLYHGNFKLSKNPLYSLILFYNKIPL